MQDNTNSWPQICEHACCIVPVHNENEVLNEVLTSLKQHFSHIICVDDGSSDSSLMTAQKCRVTVLQHFINIGQGGALSTGISYGLKKEFKYFVTFDSDGQHDPEDAVNLLMHLVNTNSEIVFGTRFARGGTTNAPLAKRLLLRVIYLTRRLIFNNQLTDAHNGLRAFSNTFANALHISEFGMGHADTFWQTCKSHNFPFSELGVNIRYTHYSLSKGQSLWNSFNIVFSRLK